MKEHAELTDRDLLEQIIKNQSKLAQFIERVNKRVGAIIEHLGINEDAHDFTSLQDLEEIMYSNENLLNDELFETASNLKRNKGRL